MAKLIRSTILYLNILLIIQYCYCKREKRGITDFLIPGINVGDIALDALKTYIYGTPVDKDQIILDKQIEHVEVTRQILSLTQDIAIAAENAPEMTVLINTLQRLPKFLNNIDDAFRQYEAFEFTKRNASEYQVRQFAIYSNNRYIGPLKEILELYSLTIPSTVRRRTSVGDYSLLSLMTRRMKGYQKLCDKYKSHQQMLMTILEGITFAELKTFLVMEYSIRVLSQLEDEINYEREVDSLKEGLQVRFRKLLINFQTHMKEASLEVWRCDPQEYIEDINYFKLNNLFQSYVVRDTDMNYAEDCYYRCGDYSKALQTMCFSAEKYFDIESEDFQYSSCRSVRRCKGFLYGCSDTFAAYSQLWTCPAEENSTRRYEFMRHGSINRLFKTKSFTRYGPSTTDMPNCNKQYTYDYRRYDLTGSWRECEMCLCTCDDSIASYSDQKVNIRPVTADKDYVVTGIRWVKKDHTIHLQIEQGKLLAKGKVDEQTLHWKDIQEPRKNYDDVARLDWEELRGFLLQDIRLAENNVLAGVKLDVVKNENIRLLTFRLLPLPYDYESGTLNYSTPFYEDPDSFFYSDDYTDEGGLWDPVVKLPERFSNNEAEDLGEARVPVDTKQASIPVHDSKKYVLLTTSHFQTDVGQNTVPFFDMQENILSPPIPLSGVGIYLKRKGDYAGFLALKLLTFNSTLHLVEKI